MLRMCWNPSLFLVLTWSNDNSRDSNHSAVDEASSAVFVYEELSNELAATIRSFRGSLCFRQHFMGLEGEPSAYVAAKPARLLTRGPPKTAILLVKMNLAGFPFGPLYFRAASNTSRIESTLIFMPRSKLSSAPRDMMP
jgi:hypothetical protein